MICLKLFINALELFMCFVICRLVNPSKETLEAGLSRELHEEVGVAVSVGVADHISSCLSQSPSSPRLITHFYIKKMTEPELKEIERAAVTTATDHGLEVEALSILFMCVNVLTNSYYATFLSVPR